MKQSTLVTREYWRIPSWSRVSSRLGSLNKSLSSSGMQIPPISRQRLSADLKFAPVRFLIIVLNYRAFVGCLESFDTWTPRETVLSNTAWAVTAIGYYLHLLALPFVQKLSLPHHMIAAMFAGFLIYSAQYTEADAVLRRAGASHLLFEVGITPVAKLGVRILHAMPFGAIDVRAHRAIVQSLLWVILSSSTLGWIGTFSYIISNMGALLDVVGLPITTVMLSSLAFIFYVQKRTVLAVLNNHVSWISKSLQFERVCGQAPSRSPLRCDNEEKTIVTPSNDDTFVTTYKFYIRCVTIGHASMFL